MANQKPTDDARVVPLDLSIERRLLLRRDVEVWRDGIRDDLKDPSKLEDPDRTRRLGATYERLIEALSRGRIELPDEEARAALQQAADGFDAAEEWEQTRTIHDAHRALLAVFEASGEEALLPGPARGAEGRAARTTGEEDLAMESAVLQRVLDVHPARVTAAELRREIVGEAADFGDRDAVDRAARDLGGVGLLHTRDEFVTPTRAALRFQELFGRE